MAASRTGAPRIRVSQCLAGWQTRGAAGDVLEEEALWVPDLHRTLSALRTHCSRPIARSLASTAECRTPFREPLQFIVIAVMSVMGGTFPDTYRGFLHDGEWMKSLWTIIPAPW